MEGFEDPFNRRCYPWGKEDDELLDFYRLLARIKSTTPALRTGGIEFLPAPDCVISFFRSLGGRKIRTVVNGGAQTVTIPIRGQVLLLRSGRYEQDALFLEQWGTAIVEEEWP